ncbi:MAG: DUF6456 domain-containing protein [Pseudochelatococcus sp.]|jgi:hypothetical protein|uniref:DUF6456 domain-containing protein n=1 Tax=Pseudochelatococcus sp. TaxID=2020869 RepID=UPI003D93942C
MSKRPVNGKNVSPKKSASPAGPRTDAETLQLLRHLAQDGNIALIGSQLPDRVILSSARGGVSLGRGSVPAAVAGTLLEQRLIRLTPDKTFAITEAGRIALARLLHAPAASSGPHRRLRTASSCDDGKVANVQVNDAESPLAWLHKRRGRNGEPFIDAACFEAGERLRRDLTLAQLMPRVTSNWTPARGDRAGGGPAIATETMVSARQRLHRALDAVEGEYAGLLLDVCGFLKGLEEVERERHWPPRSGKVVLKLALQRLARHYGLGAQANGPDRGRGIRVWQDL